MAISWAKEIWSGRTGDQDHKGVRSYVRVFRVRTTNRRDGPGLVRFATGIPRIFDAYVEGSGFTDLYARCRRISESIDQDDPLTWVVVCEFSTETTDSTQTKEDTDAPETASATKSPDLEPPQIIWGSVQFQKAVEKDVVTNKVICNSAGVPYEPPVEVERSYPTLTIRRNEMAFSPTIKVQFDNAVNSEPWFGFEMYEVKCTGITAQTVYRDGWVFWEVTYPFIINFDTWVLKLLDQGMETRPGALVSGSESLKRIVDKRGVPVTRPVLLDGNGNVLHPDGAAGAPPAPVFRSFFVNQLQPFADLNLP